MTIAGIFDWVIHTNIFVLVALGVAGVVALIFVWIIGVFVWELLHAAPH